GSVGRIGIARQYPNHRLDDSSVVLVQSSARCNAFDERLGFLYELLVRSKGKRLLLLVGHLLLGCLLGRFRSRRRLRCFFSSFRVGRLWYFFPTPVLAHHRHGLLLDPVLELQSPTPPALGQVWNASISINSI